MAANYWSGRKRVLARTDSDQNPPLETACRFESDPGHHIKSRVWRFLAPPHFLRLFSIIECRCDSFPGTVARRRTLAVLVLAPKLSGRALRFLAVFGFSQPIGHCRPDKSFHIDLLRSVRCMLITWSLSVAKSSLGRARQACATTHASYA